jgi:hypothetical protein
LTDASIQSRLRDASVSAIATVIGAVLALVGVYLTGWFTYASKDEELRYHLVEVALGILRADPKKENIKPVRLWAMDVIERDSGVKFSEGAREALSEHEIPGVKSGDVAFIGAVQNGNRLVCYYDAHLLPTDCRNVPEK